MIATLTIQLRGPDKFDRGEMTYQGASDWINTACLAAGVTMAGFAMVAEVDMNNYVKASEELIVARHLLKEGKPYAGDIVTLTIEE